VEKRRAVKKPEYRDFSCLAMIATTAFVIGNTLVAPAQTAKPAEYEVKAAYLYNFGKFVEWPSRGGAAQASSFEICLLGSDPFGPVLRATLSDEKISGKTVSVKRLQSAADAPGCRVLFIGASEEHQLMQVLAALEGSTTLTVSDMPEFLRRGGMIQFVLDGKKVRFEINLATAQRAGLTLSSELLKLAVSVRKN
jgi:YfiR/HmsC-like